MGQGDTLSTLSEEWRRRAETLRRYGGEAPAAALEACALELDAALRRHDHAILTLTEAAEESGYSASHLGRLVREGTIPNAGRPGAPRIALKDLPLKARSARADGAAPDLADSPPLPQVANARVVESIIERGRR